MNPLTTIAIFGDRGLEATLRATLHGFDYIFLTDPDKILSLMQHREVGCVASRFPAGRHSKRGVFRDIARDSATYGVPALFMANSPAQAYAALDRAISNPSVGVAYREGEVRPMLNLLRERIRDHVVKPEHAKTPGPAADLDGNQLIEQGTAFLRSKGTGRLDAKKIAALYDEPLKRFAEALGVSPAAVSQTPDSKKYQPVLGYFERAARIIPLLEAEDMFAAWAKTPNKELKGAAPIEWLFAGPKQAQKLVETVEDVLVGQPD